MSTIGRWSDTRDRVCFATIHLEEYRLRAVRQDREVRLMKKDIYEMNKQSSGARQQQQSGRISVCFASTSAEAKPDPVVHSSRDFVLPSPWLVKRTDHRLFRVSPTLSFSLVSQKAVNVAERSFYISSAVLIYPDSVSRQMSLMR